MSAAERAVALIEEQQKELDQYSPARCVGEQLKDICRAEPESAALLARDLEVKEMSIAAAEQKMKAFADGHRTGNFACVPPLEADRILREFYGLPQRREPVSAPPPVDAPPAVNVDFSAFLGR